MKIEHVAFNVQDPVGMGKWYVEHLGMTVKRSFDEPPHAHFIADDSGTVMIEIYGNDAAPVPDYKETNPLVLHLAFLAENLEADVERLIAAGATQVGEMLNAPNGDRLMMLRDPWGFAVQLVERADPMIS